jgi:dienelactone hydrolase
MKILRNLLLSVSVIFLINPVNAQMSANPQEVGAKIREMGAKLGRDVVVTTNKLYGPLLRKMPRKGVNVSKNEVYGPHERHRIDVYQPTKSKSLTPIVIHLHGGGFVRGDKKGSANIGTYLARHGILGLIANYRFAPKVKWPAGSKDIANMIKWIKANGTKFKGDVNKIFLMGSSAGAGHVASYIFFEKHQIKNDGIAGAILISGPTYELTVKKGRGHFAYFGKDRSKYSKMSSIRNINGRKIPLFIAYAEFDPSNIQIQNMLLINALYKRDKILPTIKQVQGHNHFSITRHINTKDESLGPELVEFIRTR